MKRDMNLIRKILLATEALAYGKHREEFEIEGYDKDQVAYHTALLVEAKLVNAIDTGTLDGGGYCVLSLTWEGHEFIDNARSDKIWNQVKEATLSVGGSISLAVASRLALKFVTLSVDL